MGKYGLSNMLSVLQQRLHFLGCEGFPMGVDSLNGQAMIQTSAKQPNLATGLTVHTPLYKPVQAVQTYPTLVSIILPLYKSVQAV